MSLHVLYVDDEPCIVTLAQRILQSAGLRVTGESNPTRAWEEFRSDPSSVDVVFTDCRMPEMSGFALISKIRSLRKDIPVFMVCAGVPDAQTPLLEELQVEELVLKPDIIAPLRRIAGHLSQLPQVAGEEWMGWPSSKCRIGPR